MRYGLTQRLLITPRGVTWRPMWGTVENTNRDQKSKRLTIFNIPTVFLFTAEADKGFFFVSDRRSSILSDDIIITIIIFFTEQYDTPQLRA